MYFSHMLTEKLKITATRSSGPGGQHANKVSTKVDVRFRVDDADWLEPDLREKVKAGVSFPHLLNFLK